MSLTIWTLSITAWGVVAPFIGWSMGKVAGADEFRRSYLRHPAVRDTDRAPLDDRI